METIHNTSSLSARIRALEPVIEKLKTVSSIREKSSILDRMDAVNTFLAKNSILNTFLDRLSIEEIFVAKCLIAIGEGEFIFRGIADEENAFEKVRKILTDLYCVEQFYAPIGGIAGYHSTVLKLIDEKKGTTCPVDVDTHYTKPRGIDFTHPSANVDEAIRRGIECLPQTGEIYPVGGAGDRLQLQDEQTGELLPVAELAMFGRTLLEGLIRDLQAREYLYYKLFKKQLTTPIAMMTSHEKNNHERIRNLCKKLRWFGRPEESFSFFTQPLVPVVNEEGHWCVKAPLQICFKPGGHGVIWKSAIDCGVFDRMEALGRTKLLVRQINNPIAGVDFGLSAFIGVGFLEDKAIGFASCYRLPKASEGMNVLVERATETGYTYCITNIEYTDFASRGIEDIPEEPGSSFSAFPTNTNILFVDIKNVRQATKECCIPGMLINMKTSAGCFDETGRLKELHVGRLESTMQNIADYIVDTYPQPLLPDEMQHLKSYVTYNDRRKTISVTKKMYVEGQSFLETPEGCFYDFLLNDYDLLTRYCGMEVEAVPDEETYLRAGPSFIFRYHPALGPFFSVIGSKIRGGKLANKAEWLLEAADVDIENLTVDGSFHLFADNITGHEEDAGIIRYSNNTGKCTLRNVKIINKGIDRFAPNRFWKNDVARIECLKIILHGNGEFFAENVTLQGNRSIEVPDGYRLEAYAEGEEIKFIRRKIDFPTRQWEYFFDSDNRVKLKKECSGSELPEQK